MIIFGNPERERSFLVPKTLKRVTVRCPTDRLDKRVPLVLHKLPGSGDYRHIVQLPPGVEFGLDIKLPRGMAILEYSDGSKERLAGRDEHVMVRGGIR